MSHSKKVGDRQGAGEGAEARARLGAPEPIALPDFAGLEAELEREIAQEVGPRAALRALSTGRRYLLITLALALLAGLTWMLRPRLDLEVYPAGRMVLVLAVISALVLASFVIALWPLSSRLPSARVRRLPALLGPLALALLYSLPAAHTAHPASLQPEGAAAIFVRALPCLALGSGVSFLVLLLLRAFDRGGLPASLGLAASAGLFANFLLQIHCSVTAPSHMLIGHLGVALLALGGAWLAQRVSTPLVRS